MLFLLLIVISSELHEKRRRKKYIEGQKKLHKIICVRDITFLGARPPYYVIFCRFFRLLPTFRLFRFYVEFFFSAPENGGGGWRPSCPLVSTALLNFTANPLSGKTLVLKL